MDTHRRHMPRRATTADIPALVALIGDVMAQSYPAHYSPAAIAFFAGVHAPDRLAARIERGVVLLIEENGAPVATAGLDGEEIIGLFVMPHRQGGGLGRCLMEALIGEARDRGLPRIAFSVSLPAVPFYESLGFVMGPERVTVLPTGDGVPYRQTERSLC